MDNDSRDFHSSLTMTSSTDDDTTLDNFHCDKDRKVAGRTLKSVNLHDLTCDACSNDPRDYRAQTVVEAALPM